MKGFRLGGGAEEEDDRVDWRAPIAGEGGWGQWVGCKGVWFVGNLADLRLR